MARVRSNINGLHSPTQFANNWDNLRNENTIVLSGLYYKYSRLKDNAYPNYINVSNQRLYDKYIHGVWRNPYQEEKVFAIAPPIFAHKGLSVAVKLPQNLFYSNQSNIQSIQIDLGDGRGYRNLGYNTTVRTTYLQSNLYEWKYKLTLTNGQILYSHSKIYIQETYKDSIRNWLKNTPCSNSSGINEHNFTGTQNYNGSHNSAILEIDYAQNDCVIRKPLIVVEGFETGLLGVENPLGENDLEGFIQNTNFTGNLPAQLSQYDIIYVNWRKGTDFMQRNAYLLEDIIQWVNQEKEGNTIYSLKLP